VSLYAGELPRRPLTEIDGVRLQAPMMDVSTIAAGRRLDRALPRRTVAGRSRLRRCGPRSRLLPARRSRHGHRLQRRARARPAGAVSARLRDRRVTTRSTSRTARARLERIADDVARDSATGYTVEELAQACVDIRRRVDGERRSRARVACTGQDPARFALVSFGGAGAQHACAIADALSIRRIVLHPLGGVLSAYGIGLASRRALRRCSVEKRLDPAGLTAARSALETVSRDARAALLRQGVAADAIEFARNRRVAVAGIRYVDRRRLVDAQTA
jgi:5-oxoprolinase (ATP-hydrolysing)